MQIASSGGRRLTRAVLAAREHSVENERGVARKELSKAAREAEQALEMRPTLRIVLKELAACWGEQEFDGRLMVWPSNDYLISRTGLSERSIRNALRGLIELEVIAPRDSANGKRYAVKNAAGKVVDAYGYDLAPLFARSAEFVALNDAHRRRRDEQDRQFEAITIDRRAAQEAIAALHEQYPHVAIDDEEQALQGLIARTPRRGSMAPIGDLVRDYRGIREALELRFSQLDAGQRRHRLPALDNNNGSPSEPCNKLPEEAERVLSTEHPVSVGLLLEICPAFRELGEEIRSIDDLVVVGSRLRGTIGAHKSAWLEAVEQVGAVHAAAAVLYVLQLHTDDVAAGSNRIRNPGGYFRALVRMIADRRFNLDTELHALRRRRMT